VASGSARALARRRDSGPARHSVHERAEQPCNEYTPGWPAVSGGRRISQPFIALQAAFCSSSTLAYI